MGNSPTSPRPATYDGCLNFLDLAGAQIQLPRVQCGIPPSKNDLFNLSEDSFKILLLKPLAYVTFCTGPEGPYDNQRLHSMRA